MPDPALNRFGKQLSIRFRIRKIFMLIENLAPKLLNKSNKSYLHLAWI